MASWLIFRLVVNHVVKYTQEINTKWHRELRVKQYISRGKKWLCGEFPANSASIDNNTGLQNLGLHLEAAVKFKWHSIMCLESSVNTYCNSCVRFSPSPIIIEPRKKNHVMLVTLPSSSNPSLLTPHSFHGNTAGILFWSYWSISHFSWLKWFGGLSPVTVVSFKQKNFRRCSLLWASWRYSHH